MIAAILRLCSPLSPIYVLLFCANTPQHLVPYSEQVGVAEWFQIDVRAASRCDQVMHEVFEDSNLEIFRGMASSISL